MLNKKLIFDPSVSLFMRTGELKGDIFIDTTHLFYKQYYNTACYCNLFAFDLTNFSAYAGFKARIDVTGTECFFLTDSFDYFIPFT